MKIQVQTPEEPEVNPVPTPKAVDLAIESWPGPPPKSTNPDNDPKLLPPAPPVKEEPVILQLKDSKFVRLTEKELKNQALPPYLQLELDLNPLKEGESISADRDSSIRHTGKP